MFKKIVNKIKKPIKSITSKFGVIGFFKSVIAELRATTWQSRRSVINYTTLIVICTAVVTLFLYFADAVFVALRSLVVNRVIV